MNQNPIQPVEVKMFSRLFIVMTVLMLMVSACAPTEGTDVFEVGVEVATEASSNQAVRDELQPIMRAMFSGIITDQLSVIQYTKVGCTNQDGLGGPPKCPEGVAEGTVMEVFPMLGPEGTFSNPAEMENLLINTSLKGLYAVYRVTPGPNDEPYYPVGEYAMVFERDINDLPLPIILRVQDGKIVRMDFRFGISPEDLLKEIPVEQVLIAPQEAKAWTEAVR